MKTLYEAYRDVYYNENNFYSDIVNFCEELNIFESLEESEYFANLIIENDLGVTFVQDILEYCEQEQSLNESYITEVSVGLIKAGLKAAGGVLKKVTPEIRGLSAKTLAKKGYTPGGFGKTGKPLTPQARAPQARAAQAARAARKPPEPPKPNKYADMLSQKKASQPAAPSGGDYPHGKTFVQKGWARHTAAGGPSPEKIAQRAAADPTILATMLGVAHMAGLPVSKAISGASRVAAPIVSAAKNVGQRIAPSVRRPAGAAADPWMQFMKGSKPKQLGLPKEGPSSQLPGRFLPKPPSGPKGLLPPAERSQQFMDTQAFNKNYGGGLIGTRDIKPMSQRAPKPQWGPGAAKPEPRPSGAAPKVIPGPSTRTSKTPKTNTPTPTPTTSGSTERTPYRHVSSRGTGPFRATGPSGGNPTLERLASQAARPQRGLPPRKPSMRAAGLAAAGAGALVAADQIGKRKEQKYDVYNTMDPSGKVRSRLKVGPRIVGDAALGPAKDFEDAFRKNRATGKKKFKYGSNEYTTELAKEEFYNDLINIVINEGYALDPTSAHEIVNAMSDEWLISILNGDLSVDKP